MFQPESYITHHSSIKNWMGVPTPVANHPLLVLQLLVRTLESLSQNVQSHCIHCCVICFADCIVFQSICQGHRLMVKAHDQFDNKSFKIFSARNYRIDNAFPPVHRPIACGRHAHLCTSSAIPPIISWIRSDTCSKIKSAQ